MKTLQQHYKLLLSLVLVLFFCNFSWSKQDPRPIRLLSMEDPFAKAWLEHRDDVSDALGVQLEITLMDYENSNRAIAVNAARSISAYDLVAIDIVWMGHYGTLDALLQLDEILDSRGVDNSKFISIALQAGQVNGRQLALPIQPHPEVLIYRQSVLERLGAVPPVTTEDVLTLAKRINQEIPEMYGICWNAATGAALGQQMLHFAGAFGARIIDDSGNIMIDNHAWSQAFDYARQLASWSPPMIRSMAWDQRIEQFRSGNCGLSYAWGARTAFLERENSPIAGDIGYSPAPVGPGLSPATPLGAWLLAIPANLPPTRVAEVADALIALTSEQSARLLLELGVSALPRVIDEQASRYPVLDLVAQLEASQQLKVDMRPAVKSFQALSEIIGVESHSAIFGHSSSKAALETINTRITEFQSKVK